MRMPKAEAPRFRSDGESQGLSQSRRVYVRIGTSILRPATELLKRWNRIDDGNLPFAIELCPFDDNPKGLKAMLEKIGSDIDCFVGPCDAAERKDRFSILVLDHHPCSLAMPRNHRLANKEALTLEDLEGEQILLVKQGQSPILDQIREQFANHQPKFGIIDTEHLYDIGIFNECERRGVLIETLSMWKDVHPSLVSWPVAWKYQMPCGLIYSKNPSKGMPAFIYLLSK